MQSILILDDDDQFRITLESSFKRLHYHTSSIAKISQYYGLSARNFDFAVIDLQLEKGTSLPLIPVLRKHLPNCRILVLTGFGTVTAAVKAIKSGADQFIHKPATMSQILTALNTNAESLEDVPIEAPTLARYERDYIEFVLSSCGGNISKAARQLGIHRQSLQKKLKSFPPQAKVDRI